MCVVDPRTPCGNLRDRVSVRREEEGRIERGRERGLDSARKSLLEMSRMNEPRLGISSGELLYRQSLGLQIRKDEDLRWPRRGIGERLHGFLEEGYDEGAIIAKCEASRRELVS